MKAKVFYTALILAIFALANNADAQVAKLNNGVVTIDNYGNITANSVTTTKGNSLVYRYTVGAGTNKFPTIDSAFHWLKENMAGPSELLLDGDTHLVADSMTVLFPYHLHVRGLDFQCTKIQASTGLTGKPMFNIYTGISFERVNFDATTLASYGTVNGENLMNLLTDGNYVEVTNFESDGFYHVINITGNSDLFVFDAIFSESNQYAVRCSTAGASDIDIEVTNFEGCNYGVGLLKGTSSNFYLNALIFTNGSGDTAVYYDGANYTYDGVAAIINNVWDFTGKFLSGFDFTLASGRDANIYIKSNVGTEDKSPHAKVNVVNNATTTTIGTAGRYYRAKFTNGSTYTCKYTLANNKFTYQPTYPSDQIVWLSGNVQVNQNSRTVDVCLVKNGDSTVQYSPMSVRVPAVGANQPISFSSCVYLPDLAPGDYISVYVTSSTNGDVVTVQDLTVFIKTN